MKKYILIFALNLIVCSSFAATVNDLMFNYKGIEGSVFVNTGEGNLSSEQHLLMNSWLTKFSQLYFNGEEGNIATVANLKSLELLSLCNCDEATKSRYMNDAIRAQNGKMDCLLKIKKDGENMNIYGKAKEGMVKELIVVTYGKCCRVAHIEGNFEMAKLQAAAENTK